MSLDFFLVQTYSNGEWRPFAKGANSSKAGAILPRATIQVQQGHAQGQGLGVKN